MNMACERIVYERWWSSIAMLDYRKVFAYTYCHVIIHCEYFLVSCTFGKQYMSDACADTRIDVHERNPMT